MSFIDDHDSKKIIIPGSATQKNDGWFRVDLQDNCEFLLKEDVLLNDKVYVIKKKNAGTSEEMEKNNRKVKRQ